MPETPSLRQGRKIGRTIYVQRGYEPSDDDALVGMVDSAAVARVIVAAVNGDSDMRDRLLIALDTSVHANRAVRDAV